MKFVQKLNKSDVVIESITPLYKGFFTFNQYRLKHKLHEGGWSEEITREIFERGDAIAVLPYDPNTKEFILIEQFRVAAMRTSDQPWLLEVIAGMIEDNEAPDDVCRREAREEAGIEITELQYIMRYLPSPGACTEQLTLYFALVDSTNVGGVHGLASEHEDILVHKIHEDEVMQWLHEGRFINSATIIALQWFAINRDNILGSDD
ncbi:NUDIX domain-containing protein [Alteromonas sp. a30]|uniref:NUDIX domain-containing protein n=1 Tax=Alteromonas sp. a30 TaxID=2730917 RepID=UPI00228228EA|nr:NUDIX domain-containing protein [Alteromonas sp. a30]MCY7296281.1 NUDIX domain-containing protein [Alteromonas sp. a30]